MKELKKEIDSILSLYKSNNLPKAAVSTKELIEIYPNTAVLYNILGLILAAQEKFDEAILYYKKGIKIKPDFAILYNNLGSSYKSKENLIEAEKYYKKSINIDDKIPEPYNNLGNIYRLLNKNEKAIKFYNKSILANPKFYVGFYNLGVIYKSLGDFKSATTFLKKAIEINNYFFTAHRVLSQIISYKNENYHYNKLINLYEDTKINNSEKAEIAFALGKALDDKKDFEKAYKFFYEGNALRRKKILFSKQESFNEFKKIKDTFNKNFFLNIKKNGSPSKIPIFILGMPRSGTTLVEQILSSHSQVFGADELNYFPEIVKKYFDSGNFNLYKKNNFNNVASIYINKLNEISNNSKKVTDKLPINFKWIGIIKLLLPNSKIIHCVRDPRDTCLSIFKNYFTNTELNFAYNLDELSEFYKLYTDLMNHWSLVLPNFVNNIFYENLIKNPEKEIRSLLKICNLSWDKKCLEFYKNRRAIKTSSDTQVRKKIYKNSINSWKNYEKQLNTFYKRLVI